MGRQGRWVPPSPGHLYPSRCVFVCVAYAYILLGRLGRPRQGGNDRYRSTTHSTVVADQYDYKGGHEGGSESSHQAPYAHALNIRRICRGARGRGFFSWRLAFGDVGFRSLVTAKIGRLATPCVSPEEKNARVIQYRE